VVGLAFQLWFIILYAIDYQYVFEEDVSIVATRQSINFV